jgi:hypothetical protein
MGLLVICVAGCSDAGTNAQVDTGGGDVAVETVDDTGAAETTPEADTSLPEATPDTSVPEPDTSAGEEAWAEVLLDQEAMMALPVGAAR